MNYSEQAQEYLNEGFNPIPCKKTKAPQLETGHRFLYETIDKIEQRFANCENIGVVCGDVSNGFYAIDFDAHNGESISNIYEEFIEIPFVSYLIQSGFLSCYKTTNGFHIYLKLKSTISGTVYSRWEDGKSVMIELRGNGQYVVTHPSKNYEHLKGVELIKLDYITDEEFNSLVEVARSFDDSPEYESEDDGTKRKWPKEWDNSSLTGRFNNEGEDEIKELLDAAGWSYSFERKDGIEYWVRPNKDVKDGISATWGKRKNMFYVFTSSAPPFESGKGYTPFQVLTILKFGGDWKRAKDYLKPSPYDEPKKETKAPKFPIDVFPIELQKFMTEYKNVSGFSVDFMSCGLISAVSTIVGNKIKLNAGWNTTPIFWFCCVGAAGSRKSPPINLMMRPLNKMDAKNGEEFNKELERFNEYEMLPPKEKKYADKIKKPFRKQRVLNDATVESVVETHSFNPNGMILYRDELAAFYSSMNQYKGGQGGDSQFWIESFNNHMYTVNRKGKTTITVENTFLNILGTIQPEIIKEIIPKTKASGFADRFLYTAELTDVKYFDLTARINKDIAAYYDQFLEALEYEMLMIKDNFIYDLSDDMRLILQCELNTYRDVIKSDETEGAMKNYVAKLESYMPRFTLIYAIIDWVVLGGDFNVNEKHIKDAKKSTDYFMKTGQTLFNNAEDSLDADEIIKRAGAKNKKSIAFALIEAGITDKKLILQKSGMAKQNWSKYFKESEDGKFRVI